MKKTLSELRIAPVPHSPYKAISTISSYINDSNGIGILNFSKIWGFLRIFSDNSGSLDILSAWSMARQRIRSSVKTFRFTPWVLTTPHPRSLEYRHHPMVILLTWVLEPGAWWEWKMIGLYVIRKVWTMALPMNLELMAAFAIWKISVVFGRISKAFGHRDGWHGHDEISLRRLPLL